MFVSLDQIEFYHGPPCQQFQSSLSSTRRQQSSALSVTEPVHHSLPAGPVLAPGSHALAFPDNRSEPSFQSHGGLSASIGEPCNVFDVELANIDHETEGSQLQNTGTVEGRDSSCPNGEISHDQEPQVDERGSSGSGPCCGPEPGKLGAKIDGSAAIETSLSFSRPPSCLSEQANSQDSATSMFPQVDHQLDQVSYQAHCHDRTGAVHTDEGCASRASSVSCGALARKEVNTPYDRTTSGYSRQPDMPPLFSAKYSPAVESNHHDEAASGKQGDVTGAVSSDERRNSSQGETSRRHPADDHEQNQESGRNGGDISQLSQVTTQSGHPSTEGLGADTPKRNPSIAVVVPPPPWARTRVTRSTTRASARKKGLQQGQGRDSDHCAAESSIESTERFGKKRQCQKKKPSCAVGPASAGGPTSMQSDCSPQNQNILGRAILTVQSNGSKPAYFFTFMPEPVQVRSPQDPHHHWSKSSGPPANISGRPQLYSSEDNALLVRLKERERMSWLEISQHFPGRNVSSLQVHYSAKLRNKAVGRSRKPQRR